MIEKLWSGQTIEGTDGSGQRIQVRTYPPYYDYLKSNLKLLEKLAQSRNLSIDLSRLPPRQLDEAIEWVFEKFLRHRSLLGTPESCTELVRKLFAIGVQEIACLLDFGPSTQAIMNSLPRLQQLKDRFQVVAAETS